MTANSNIKKFGDRPLLYIDMVTGIYLVRMYHAGGTRSRSLKTTNEKIAVQRMSAAIKEITVKDRSKLSNKLVSDYFDGFLKSLESEDLSKATMVRYSVSWRHHVEPFWANLKEEQISQDAYSEYLAWHKKEKGTKVFNHLKLLRGLFKYMIRTGAKMHPVSVDLPKKEKDSNNESKGTYIDPREFKAIIESPELHLHVALMIELAYQFGFRLGELCNLRRDRVKIRAGRVSIELQSKDTKTRKARTVPLTGRLGTFLQTVLKTHSSDWVFPAQKNHKAPVSKQVIDRAWLNAKEAAGITRRIRFHDLRHTAATNFADLGIDPVKACALLGMTLKIYMSTYVKVKSLNLSSVIDQLEKSQGDA